MPDESLVDPAGTSGGPIQHFTPTGGRVLGVLGVALAVGVVVLGVVRPDDVVLPVMIGAVLVGVLSWAALLRPRVSADTETLYLRNMLETVEVPLAAVDELVVRQMLAVRVGERRYVSPAVGRKLRTMVKSPKPAPLIGPDVPETMADAVGPATPSTRPATVVDYADHVEDTLRRLTEEARQRRGIGRYSDESLALAAGVRRRPAWPEIAAIGALVLALVVSVLV